MEPRVSGPLIFQAIMKKDLDCLRRFIRVGADVDCTDLDGRTPLFLAASEGLLDVVGLAGTAHVPAHVSCACMWVFTCMRALVRGCYSWLGSSGRRHPSASGLRRCHPSASGRQGYAIQVRQGSGDAAARAHAHGFACAVELHGSR